LKTWTQTELNHVVGLLQPLVGLRLQEILEGERDFVLGFYSSKGLLWLWIDLSAVCPCLLPWSELPFRPAPAKSPLSLFARAHFAGRVLGEVSLAADSGRVARLRFGEEPEASVLELRLFPHGRNVLAFAAGRSVAWQKPQPLSEPAGYSDAGGKMRSLERLREEWTISRGRAKSAGGGNPKLRLQKDLEKKQKAAVKVREELHRKQELPWRNIGTWLKENQTLEVPREWEPYIDKRRKLSWNIEQCFAKAREVEGKVFGTEKRLAELEREIANLAGRLTGPAEKLIIEPPPAKLPVHDMEAQGRTLRLSQDLVVIAGKSAADNLKILRKARAWDLWFHLRDYPSSHAVLFRNKSAKINDAILHSVASWFVKNHFGAKAPQHAGEKFDLIVAECRHVRPIKGDKIGRVTYRDERILTHQFNPTCPQRPPRGG
jgi:hypothetical protein